MYIPPDGDNADFQLEIFDPPSGDEADFQLLDADKIIRVNAHVSLNFSSKAQAETTGFTRITELKTESGVWICPASVKRARIECWGGGASGGPNAFAAQQRGGGGGAYARDTIVVSPGKTYSYTIARRSYFSLPDGTDGENTYWDDGSEVKAVGGKEKVGGGWASCVGKIRFSGGNAARRGGGGGAGSTGTGKAASGDIGGGETPDYGGAGGNGGVGESGEPGGNYGGGGGGSGLYAGSSGAPGLIRISYVPGMEAEVSAHVSINLGARAEAEAKSLAANRSYTDMFGIIRSRKR